MLKAIENDKEKTANIICVLLAIILVLGSALIKNDLVKAVLSAMGTALFCASAISIIYNLIYMKRDERRVKMLTSERAKIASHYKNARKSASETHDLLSIAVSYALKDIVNDEEFLDKVLTKGLNVRLMFLNPKSTYVHQRAEEDEITYESVIRELNESIEVCEKINLKLSERRDKLVELGKLKDESEGGFEVRVYDGCPYSTIFKVDKTITWGVYHSAGRGVNSPAFVVTEENKELFYQLNSHFSELWLKSKESYIFKYIKQEKPMLNKMLISNLKSFNSSIINKVA